MKFPSTTTDTPRRSRSCTDVGHELEDRGAEALRLGALGDSELTTEYLLVRVFLDERQPELVGQPARECRLAGAGRPRDDYEERRRRRTYGRMPPCRR